MGHLQLHTKELLHAKNTDLQCWTSTRISMTSLLLVLYPPQPAPPRSDMVGRPIGKINMRTPHEPLCSLRRLSNGLNLKSKVMCPSNLHGTERPPACFGAGAHAAETGMHTSQAAAAERRNSEPIPNELTALGIAHRQARERDGGKRPRAHS